MTKMMSENLIFFRKFKECQKITANFVNTWFSRIIYIKCKGRPIGKLKCTALHPFLELQNQFNFR